MLECQIPVDVPVYDEPVSAPARYKDPSYTNHLLNKCSPSLDDDALDHIAEKLVNTERDDGFLFNIKGNDFRLIVSINFIQQACYVIWFGTHNEYDSINASTISFDINIQNINPLNFKKIEK